MPITGSGQFPWYKHWWGIILSALLVLFLAAAVIFITITVRYWWQLRQGLDPLAQFNGKDSFTVSSQSAPGGSVSGSIATDDDPALGRPGAPVTIVEFVDYKCPNCLAAAPIMKRVVEKYGNKVRFIVRDFPVESTHPGATLLSQIGYCAQKQNRFWPMDEALFSAQNTLSEPLSDADFIELARQADVVFAELKVCSTSREAVQEVTADYLSGVSNGVQGTPTFFVNGRRVEGTVPFEIWEKYLNLVE